MSNPFNLELRLHFFPSSIWVVHLFPAGTFSPAKQICKLYGGFFSSNLKELKYTWKDWSFVFLAESFGRKSLEISWLQKEFVEAGFLPPIGPIVGIKGSPPRWFKPWPFHPRSLEVTKNHWKGSRELTIPKMSPAELPGPLIFCWSCITLPATNRSNSQFAPWKCSHWKTTSPFLLGARLRAYFRYQFQGS